jgi:hypothetical protein
MDYGSDGNGDGDGEYENDSDRQEIIFEGAKSSEGDHADSESDAEVCACLVVDKLRDCAE